MLRKRRGFTLLEAMIVVAIIGVIAALSVQTLAGLGARNATQNATNDLLATIQSARALSVQNSSDVYVFVYPTMSIKWSALATGGMLGNTSSTVTGGILSAEFAGGNRGAVIIYEDYDGDFMNTGTGNCGGSNGNECNFSAWSPESGQLYTSSNPRLDRLAKILDLERYPKQNVEFGGFTDTQWKAPFGFIDNTRAALVRNTGCSFCTNDRGIIQFSDGRAIFYNGTGQVVADPVAGLGLRAHDNHQNQTLIAIVRATGIVTTVKQ